MQSFEEPHTARKRQFGHPWSMGLVGLSYLKIQRCLQQTAAYA